jgi:hypothetical protein
MSESDLDVLYLRARIFELERERDAAHSEVIPKILAALGPLGEYGREQCNRADKAEAENRALREALHELQTAEYAYRFRHRYGGDKTATEQRLLNASNAALKALAAPQEPAK